MAGIALQIIGIGQVDYEASPTATSLRDNLITLGLMAAAAPAARVPDRVWVDDDDRGWVDDDDRGWVDDE